MYERLVHSISLQLVPCGARICIAYLLRVPREYVWVRIQCAWWSICDM